MKEGFPLHDAVIPKLLDSIEDHEQDIIDIITYAVGNARLANVNVFGYTVHTISFVDFSFILLHASQVSKRDENIRNQDDWSLCYYELCTTVCLMC